MICRVVRADRWRCLPPAIHFSDAHKDIVAVFYIRYRIVDRLQPVAAVSQCGSHYLTDPPSLAQRVCVFYSMTFDTAAQGEAATRSSFVLFPERSGQCLHYLADLLLFSLSRFLSSYSHVISLATLLCHVFTLLPAQNNPLGRCSKLIQFARSPLVGARHVTSAMLHFTSVLDCFT
jgi:hypothetical protein